MSNDLERFDPVDFNSDVDQHSCEIFTRVISNQINSLRSVPDRDIMEIALFSIKASIIMCKALVDTNTCTYTRKRWGKEDPLFSDVPYIPDTGSEGVDDVMGDSTEEIETLAKKIVGESGEADEETIYMTYPNLDEENDNDNDD